MRRASSETKPAGTATSRGLRARAPRVRQVPAVTRAVAILKLLGKSEAPQGLQAIARRLGLVPSTCLHILRVLVDEELVILDPASKRYSLGPGILTVARYALRRNGFADVVQPTLDRLSHDYNVTAVGIQVLGLDHMVVVAISRSAQALRLHVDIGSRFPALISATGRCIAAFGGYPQAELERRFKLLRWDRPPSLAAWRRDIEKTRALGYAVDDGNYITGVTIIAAPVVTRQQVSHAIVVVCVSEQARQIGVARLGKELREAAAEISVGLDAWYAERKDL
ncbi:MAG: IclR family transcriptional regulator [Rhodospirillales bacterium]|nr:IclR family transcriptional regulator [Rhodospirillales bacterium]